MRPRDRVRHSGAFSVTYGRSRLTPTRFDTLAREDDGLVEEKSYDSHDRQAEEDGGDHRLT
jgi:hypothetical protein